MSTGRKRGRVYQSPAKMRRFRNLMLSAVVLELGALFWITGGARPL